ncbi:MAG: LysR family transcriptional regulator [Pseudomonadales bacterium]
MDLRSLRYFESVYELRSISAAARDCFIAQPSISAAIQQLESTLGVPLFVRHPKGVSPTEAGEKLYPLSKNLTGKALAIRNVFNDKPQPQPFRLGLMRSLGAERMSLLLKDLTVGQEAMQLTLVNPEEACDARIIDVRDQQMNELFQPLWTDRYQLALPQGHELSLKPRVVVEDLNGVAFINREPCNMLGRLKQQMIKQEVSVVVRANIRTLEYALGLVSAGVGAALVPDWDSTQARSDLLLRPFEDVELEQRIGLAYQDNAQVTPALLAAINLCKKIYQERV